MNDDRLRELLASPPPGEREAEDRSWRVVQAAFEARADVRPARHRARPLLALAACLAVLGAAFSPPGRAVLGELREAIGTAGGRDAGSALVSLPAPGRLLVNSPAGVWVVQRDGSKRLLAGYADASWSPKGLFVAASRGRELVALEPNGTVRWSLGRSSVVRSPHWSYDGYRIAYRAGPTLRVVNGDGTGDRLVARGLDPVAPAWRPGTHHVVFSHLNGRLVVLDADTRTLLWSHGLSADRPIQLAWSDDGKQLLAVSRSSLATFDASGRKRAVARLDGEALDADFVPGRHAFALARWLRPRLRSAVHVFDADTLRPRGRPVFSGAGVFGDVAWSPNRKWLLLSWPSADQWLFVRSADVRRVVAVSGLGRAFDPRHPRRRAAPRLAGWCCSD